MYGVRVKVEQGPCSWNLFCQRSLQFSTLVMAMTCFHLRQFQAFFLSPCTHFILFMDHVKSRLYVTS